MENVQPQPLSLSQAHLNLLTTCPRKFQHVYLEQLNAPQSPQQQARQTLGARFHWLMQQQELGLAVTAFIQADPDLRRWFAAFTQTPPRMLAGERHSEYRQTLIWQDYLLVSVYDLLILGPQQAQILDWKTYSRPQNPQWLRQNWQTRLYPFLLVETSNYAPHQVSMTYWFAESSQQEGQSHSLTFAYSDTLHEQTRQDLTRILNQLTDWLQADRQGEGLPQVETAANHCPDCSFVIRCQRQLDQSPQSLPTAKIATIPEIPL